MYNKCPLTCLNNCYYLCIICVKKIGGSDDAAGCAVMLETLRIITQSPKILKHSVIFLFNGAEENLLQVY